MTCGRSVKEKNSHSFITIFFIMITPQSLVPKFSCSPINRSPITFYPIACSATLTTRLLALQRSLPPIACSPIACLLPPTWYLVFFRLTSNLINRLLPPKLFWSSFVSYDSLPSTHLVPGLLLFHISLHDW